MKPWIILIAVALVTTATATVALPLLSQGSTPGSPGGPQLVAPPVEISENAPEVEVTSVLTHDFGIMAQETEGKHGWIFQNKGKGTLELRNLGTDCSCTIAQIGKTDAQGKTMLPVAPGKEERVELTWNTRQLNGAYKKSAKIGTNDPRQPLVMLSVEGKVYPAVQVVPSDSTVSYQTISNDEPAVRKAFIYSKDRPDLKITRLVSDNPAELAVESRPMNAEELAALEIKQGIALELTYKPSGEIGAFKHEVLAEIDHPDKREVRLKVAGTVTGPVSLIPSRAIIHNATSSDGGSIILIVWVRGRANTKVTLEQAPAGIDATFTEIPQPDGVAGTKYRMTVRVVPGTDPGQIQGEIVLQTDHPQARRISVPVDALILGSS